MGRERERERENYNTAILMCRYAGYFTGHNVNTILWSGDYKDSTVWSNTNTCLSSNNTYIVPKRS